MSTYLSLHNSGLCTFCTEKETIQHFLFDCMEFQQYQETLIQFAYKEQIPISLESFLNSPKIFIKLFEYIIQTGKDILRFEFWIIYILNCRNMIIHTHLLIN